jgi:carboxyl-terminal processing protease
VDEAIYKRWRLGTVRRMFKRFVSIGLGVIAGYLMTLGVMQVVNAWGLWPDSQINRSSDQVSQVLRLLNRHYVDETEVTAPKLADHAIQSMLGALDPYSQFLPPQAFRHLEEEVDGAFGGIGVQVEELNDRIVVVTPIAGTPGERAGILRGDVFVAVDGEDVGPLKLEQLVARLRGKPGTSVTLTVERGDPARRIDFTLKREVIRVESVRDVEMLEEGIGYVRVSIFAERTGRDFKAALARLREEGARAIVIDLRNNPGGLLNTAAEVVEPFFPRGELIVYTQGRRRQDRIELRAKGEREALRLPLAVLINNGSASAAEIVAGALQDTERAVLIGEKTFGKGSVQTIFPLRGGSALRLTTARYYTPSGVVIHEQGIYPDIREVLSPEEEKAIFLSRLRPDISDPADFRERFGVAPAEDTQLAAALRELRSELAGAPPTRRTLEERQAALSAARAAARAAEAEEAEAASAVHGEAEPPAEASWRPASSEEVHP